MQLLSRARYRLLSNTTNSTIEGQNTIYLIGICFSGSKGDFDFEAPNKAPDEVPNFIVQLYFAIIS